MITDILKQFNKISSNSTQTRFINNDTFIVSNYSEIKILKDGWDQLCQECEIPNFFTSYDWIKCIWDFNNNFGEPQIYVYYVNNEIIAILPLIKLKNNDKTTVSLMHNPFVQANDILFNLKHLKLVSSWFIKILKTFDFTWHNIKIGNITDNCLITKIINHINKYSDHKFKIKIDKKTRYIPLKILANNWQSWQEQQNSASINAFNQLLEKYKDKYKIFFKAQLFTDNNPLTTENIHQDLHAILEKKLKLKIINDNQRLSVVNAFLQKFRDLDNYKHLLKCYHWYYNNKVFATQYLFINNHDTYYIATETLVGLEQSVKVYLQSLILKHCFEQNTNKFYLGTAVNTWQQFWHSETENIYEFTLSNSTS